MPPRKKKVAPASVGLEASEVGGGKAPAAVKTLCDRVETDGGTVLSRYRDPYGSHWLVLAALPIDRVAPTPYQRELSDTHTKRLEAVIPKVGRFLDPLIAVAAPDGQDAGYWTPNGMHRLEAMKRLGARSVVVLLVPDAEVAYRILALNTEKAHNLKDKALEVIRMADGLAGDPVMAEQPESTWAFEFEEPAYLTVGHCYAEKARFSGGAYLPVVRRCESFFDEPIGEAIETRKARAAKLLELDATIAKMLAKAEAFDASKIKPSDLAATPPVSGD